MRLPEVDQVEQYIRDAAVARGINPDIAVRVAKSEGLGKGIWQSNYRKGGVREPSYGPFQLLVGGKGTGFPVGMGNAFQRETGLDPSDPQNVYKSIDYALDQAAKDGWGAWYGAKHVGIGRRDGLSGAQPIGVVGRGEQKLSSELTDFVAQTEADASLANLMAGEPGIPEGPSAFEMFGLLNETNTRPRQSPVPGYKPDNPANPTYSDNAVGPLAQRDYGYDLPKTTGDLIAALGGPAQTQPSIGSAGAEVQPSTEAHTLSPVDYSNLPAIQSTPSFANSLSPVTPREIGPVARNSAPIQGYESPARSFTSPSVPDFTAVRPSQPQELSPFDPIGPEISPVASYGPSQRLGPRGASSVPDVPPSRFDTAFSPFDAPEVPSTATNDLPAIPGVQYVGTPSSGLGALSVGSKPGIPTAKPRSSLPMIDEGVPPINVPKVDTSTNQPEEPDDKNKKRGLGQKAAVIGDVLLGGALAGPLGALTLGVLNRKANISPTRSIANIAGRGLNGLGSLNGPLVSRQGFEQTPLGRASAAARKNGGFDNRTFTKTYAEQGGNWDNVAAAQEQRERSLAGQKTVGDAFGGLFR